MKLFSRSAYRGTDKRCGMYLYSFIRITVQIESIEDAAFKTMLLVADKMGRPDVMQMIQECYEDARE